MEDKKKWPSQVKESGWTVEDYYQLPEDGHQYELVDGRLELKPSPTSTHQRVGQQLFRCMTDQCESDYILILAPMDVILSDSETRQPDLLMVHREREHIIQEHAVVGPPDLVIEILSPGSGKRDRMMKRESYARFLVPEYWIVDPAHLTIEQYVLVESGQPYVLQNLFDKDDVLYSDKLPCASFRVEEALKIR